MGVVNQIDVDKVIPDRELSIYEGAIAPLGNYKNAMIFWQIGALLEKYDVTLKTPVKELPDDAIDEVLYGSILSPSQVPIHINPRSSWHRDRKSVV